MSPKLHEFAVVLQRDGQATPWGIRLVGGNDLDTPLIITRVITLAYVTGEASHLSLCGGKKKTRNRMQIQMQGN